MLISNLPIYFRAYPNIHDSINLAEVEFENSSGPAGPSTRSAAAFSFVRANAGFLLRPLARFLGLRPRHRQAQRDPVGLDEQPLATRRDRIWRQRGGAGAGR
jgi:hypothetical protein